MTGRPEPVEAYRLCDLPTGTNYGCSAGGTVFTIADAAVECRQDVVIVVEWPQRTYDVRLSEAVVRRAAAADGESLVGSEIAEACRAALQEQGS